MHTQAPAAHHQTQYGEFPGTPPESREDEVSLVSPGATPALRSQKQVQHSLQIAENNLLLFLFIFSALIFCEGFLTKRIKIF